MAAPVHLPMRVRLWMHAARCMHDATLCDFGDDFHMILACRRGGHGPVRCLAYRSPTTALRFYWPALAAVSADDVAVLVVRCDGREYRLPLACGLRLCSVRSDAFDVSVW